MAVAIQRLYNKPVLGLVALSFEVIIEHMQTFSFLNLAIEKNGGAWNSNIKDLFLFLDKLAMRFGDGGYISLFGIACLVNTLALLTYLLDSERIHSLNVTKGSPWALLIWVVDHLLFGIGFIPMVSQFLSAQFCHSNEEMRALDGVNCWDAMHVFMLQVGFIYVGIVLLIAGGLFPVLRNERNGVESQLEREYYFPGIYKSLLVSVALFFAPVKFPKLGAVVCVLAAIYLYLHGCYKQVHVSALKMGSIWGLCWGFICAEVATYHSEVGSQMVYGWGGVCVLGYFSYYIRHCWPQSKSYKILPKYRSEEITTAL